jgi:hypothetical protein
LNINEKLSAVCSAAAFVEQTSPKKEGGGEWVVVDLICGVLVVF